MNVTRTELTELAERYREQTARRPQAHPLEELGVSDPYRDCHDTHAANEDFLARFSALPGSPDEVRAGLLRSAQSYNNRAVLGAVGGVLLGGSGILGGVAMGFLRGWQVGLALGLAGAGVLTVGILVHNQNGALEDSQRVLVGRLDRWLVSADEFQKACPARLEPETSKRFEERPEHLVVGGIRLPKRPGE